MNVEDLVAFSTVKVVMVVAGDFESGGLSWQVNSGDELFLNQEIQIAVDGGQVQVGYGLLGIRQDFWRQQRPGRPAQGLGNRGALFSGSGHAESVEPPETACN